MDFPLSYAQRAAFYQNNACIFVFAYDVELAKFTNKTQFNSGVSVEDVKQNSIFDNAGIKNGDIIIEINDTPLNSMIDFRKLLYSLNDGDEISLKILRNDETLILRTKIECK